MRTLTILGVLGFALAGEDRTESDYDLHRNNDMEVFLKAIMGAIVPHEFVYMRQGDEPEHELRQFNRRPPNYKQYDAKHFNTFKAISCSKGNFYKPDVCNLCTCIGGSLYMCTMKKCLSIVPSKNKGREKRMIDIAYYDNNGNRTQLKQNGLHTSIPILQLRQADQAHQCENDVWYSLGNQNCNNCYCIDGVMGVCHLDYCQDSYEQLKLELPKINKRCEVGEAFSHGDSKTCTKCQCSETNYWGCEHLLGPCLCIENCELEATNRYIMRNARTKCGICFCKNNGDSVCSTDDQCAFQRDILESSPFHF